MSDPAYLKLYRQLRDAVTDGTYPYGSRLPSKRTLAADRGVSLITVAHAYDILCDEGYVTARERSGFFVSYRGKDLYPVREAPSAPPAPASAPRDAFPFSVLARTMRRTLSVYGERLLQRSPGRGCPELREALSAYLARSRGIKADAGQIVIGSGAEYLYGLIVQLLGRDKLYGIEDPSYGPIRLVYEAAGASCERLSLGADGIRSEALRNSRADVLHVTPFRSFPSGVSASASKRSEYIRWALERNAVIVEDDYDSEFTLSSKSEDTLYSLSDRVNVIYLNTFSRTVAPSVRVGYMVLPPGLDSRFGEKAGFYSCTVPVFEQMLLTELLRSGDFERHLNRVRRKLRKSQKNGDG